MSKAELCDCLGKNVLLNKKISNKKLIQKWNPNSEALNRKIIQ